MSIFGSDGMDHQLRHFKAQVAAKDAEVNSIRNELTKKDELLSTAKRAREDMQYELQKEADRAEIAERALQARNIELSTLRQTTFNLESTLKTANEKLMEEEKETQRLQYDLDCAASSNSDEKTRRLQDEKITLQSKVKDLEGTLRQKESEIEALRADGFSSGGLGGQPSGRSDKARLLSLENEVAELREENAKLKNAVPFPDSTGIKKSPAAFSLLGASPSPIRDTKSRRRSTSLTTENRVQDLEAELAILRSAQGSGEINTLRCKLVAAVTARDKLENQKLALEKASKRELEEMGARLDEMRDELDFYRGNRSDKEKGQAEKGRQELEGKIGALEELVQRKLDEVVRLEKEVARIGSLEAELETEREIRRQLEMTPTTSVSATHIAEFNNKIASLESALAKARSPTTHVSSASSAKQLRQLQRELDGVKRDREALQAEVDRNDDVIARKDEEILRLRGAVPLPGSPTVGPRVLVDDQRVEELEQEVEELKADIENKRSEGVEQVKALQQQLGIVEKELEETRLELRTIKRDYERFHGETEVLTSQYNALQADVERVRGELSVKAELASTLEATVSELRERLSTAQISMAELRSHLEFAQQQAQDAASALTSRENELATSRQRQQELEAAVQHRSHDDSEVDVLKEALQSRDARVAEIEATLEQVERRAEALTSEERAARAEAKRLASEVQQLQQQVDRQRTVASELKKSSTANDALQERLDDTIQLLKEEEATAEARRLELEDAKISHAQATFKAEEIEERLRETNGRLLDLEDRLNEAQETLGNRSTESEARSKDEALFELKERLETLQKSLAAERKEHEREIQLLEFLRSEDAGEAMKREESMRQQIAEVERRLVETEGQLAAHLGQVAALQSRINELEAASTNSRPSDEREKHVTLMHSKIEKLRIERDDLRQKLSYLTHENRFALRAAEADKMSAVEDLHRVRADLRQKTSAYEVLEADSASLQDRVVSITARLQSAEASFAAASTDKHDLADRVAQLELDLDRAVKERDDNKVGLVQLASDHARVQTENAAAKQELEIAQKQQRNLEEEVDRLRAGSNAQGPSAEVVQGEEPRRRTSSGASVKELDDVQQMANDLRARLGRRELVIANLQRDLQKERANCAAAGDAVAEHEAEKQALEIALESARQELESKATEIFSLASQLDDARAELGQNAQTLRISQEETEALRVEEAALREQLAVMKDEMSTLSSESSELKGSSAAVVEHLEQARRTEARLRAEVDTSRAEVDILQQQLSTARQRSVESSAATITSLETERNQAQSRMGELEMQLSEVLDKLAAGEKKRAETESLTVSELDEATTRLAELEKAVSAKGERVGELENEVKVLVDELSSAETAHGEALQEAEAKYAELQSKHDGSVKEGQGREATLRLEIKGYSKKVEEVEILLQDSRADLETEKSRADALLLTADERRVIIDSLRAKVDELEAGSTSAAERSLALESEMAQLREQLAMAIDKEVAIARDLENITATYGEALLAIEKLEVQVNEARSREEQREATIQSLREEMAKLEEQAQKTAESLATQEGEAKKLSKNLEDLQEQLLVARQEASKASDTVKSSHVELERLTADNARMKAELTDSAAKGQFADVEELQERIQELEASLTIKVQEVDEADDRVREIYKTNAKLEKKVAKLQRQLMATSTETQTALNTVMNAKLSSVSASSSVAAAAAQTVASAAPAVPSRATVPPPVPTPKAAPAPTTSNQAAITLSPARAPLAPQPRSALRSVNIFDKSQQSMTVTSTPTAGAKRLREEPPDEKLPAEAIMLPPANLKVSPFKAGTRTGFTPRSSASTAATRREGAASKENATTRTQSVFARTAVRNNAFAPAPLPLPPRNAFSVDP